MGDGCRPNRGTATSTDVKELKMNKSQKAIAIGISAGLIALVIGASHLKGNDDEEGRGERIAMSQLPAAVKAAIDRERTGGTIKEIEKSRRAAGSCMAPTL
jgi:hypothetical protein